MIHRRIHSAEFKRDAVQLARTGGNLSYTARELGLNASLLRKWLTTEKEQHDTIFENRTLARQAIFDYIEVFY